MKYYHDSSRYSRYLTLYDLLLNVILISHRYLIDINFAILDLALKS